MGGGILGERSTGAVAAFGSHIALSPSVSATNPAGEANRISNRGSAGSNNHARADMVVYIDGVPQFVLPGSHAGYSIGTASATDPEMIATVNAFVSGWGANWTITPGELPRLTHNMQDTPPVFRTATGTPVVLNPPDGDGSENSPFIISDPEHLTWMNHSPHLLYAANPAFTGPHYFRLVNDIIAPDNLILNAGPMPFSGTFEGAPAAGGGNYTITVNINRTHNDVGLFASAGAGAVFRNFNVAGTIRGANRTGGLVGYGRANPFTIENVRSYVQVTGNNDVGGLVGRGRPAITGSSAHGNVRANAVGGGLVGFFVAGGSVTDSFATGDVTTTVNDAGGLVGTSHGNITNSHATGNVTGDGISIGGLVGFAPGGPIYRSFATGNVSGRGGVGGLVGRLQYQTSIDHSHATGNVTGVTYDAGGLVGYGRGGRINRSFATGDVTGNTHVGGLVGSIGAPNVEHSYATGNVIGIHNVGGLVGRRNGGGIIAHNFATGEVTAENYAGGIIGRVAGTGNISNNIALNPSVSISEPGGHVNRLGGIVSGTGFGANNHARADMAVYVDGVSQLVAPGGHAGYPLGTADATDAEMIAAVNARVSGWGAFWTITPGYLPRLAGNMQNSPPVFRPAGTAVVIPRPPGDGSEASPFLLSTPANLVWMSSSPHLWYTGNPAFTVPHYFRLENDIIAPDNWMITGGHFRGTFDGAPAPGGGNHTITLNINRPGTADIGMFRAVNSGTVLRNFNVAGTVTGGNHTGGLVGRGGTDIAFTIENVHADVQITGANSSGGLVGRARPTIINSSARGDVRATMDGGGLVGFFDGGGSVTGSFATGNVVTTSGNNAGGLVGRSSVEITYSHATGNVTASGSTAGGLVGYAPGGRVYRSFATGNVSGNENVGGLVGNNTGPNVEHSYATGNVTGRGINVGGLIGRRSGGTIAHNFATGEVTGASDAGGIIGRMPGGTANMINNIALNPSVSISQPVGQPEGQIHRVNRVGGTVTGGSGFGANNYARPDMLLFTENNPHTSVPGNNAGIDLSYPDIIAAVNNIVSSWAGWTINPGALPTLTANPQIPAPMLSPAPLSALILDLFFFLTLSDNLGGGFAVIVPDGETAGFFQIGETVTIVALPAPGYSFTHWQDGYGDIISTEESHTITINTDMTYSMLYLTAIYTPEEPVAAPLIVTVTDNLDANLTFILPYYETVREFNVGETVSVAALPYPEQVFSHWENGYGEIISHHAQFSFVIQEGASLQTLNLIAIYVPYIPDDVPAYPLPPIVPGLPPEEEYYEEDEEEDEDEYDEEEEDEDKYDEEDEVDKKSEEDDDLEPEEELESNEEPGGYVDYDKYDPTPDDTPEQDTDI